MADKNISVPEPTPTVDNVRITVQRIAGVNRIYVEYDPPGVAKYHVPLGFAPGVLTGPETTALSTATAAILAYARPRMVRTDGGDGTGF